MCDMVSLSDKISARFLVPRTLRNVVAARSLVEWLQIWKDAVGEVEVLSLEPVCCKKQQKKSSWPVTGLGTSDRPELFQNKSLIITKLKPGSNAFLIWAFDFNW